jgi:hypothetical protein
MEEEREEKAEGVRRSQADISLQSLMNRCWERDETSKAQAKVVSPSISASRKRNSASRLPMRDGYLKLGVFLHSHLFLSPRQRV